MALPDYQDDGTGYPAPDTPPSQQPSPQDQDAARRAFIREEYIRIMGVEPSDAELAEALDRYTREGGDQLRAWLTARAGTKGGDSGGLGDILRYDGPMAPNYQFAQAPGFRFTAPTANDVYADPSFELRRGLGQKGIEASAAGRGMLRTGGTLKDILDYNQSFASQEYGNIYDRRFREAQASFQPQWNEWAFTQGAKKDQADKEWQRYWDDWTYNNPSATDIFKAGVNA